MTGKCTAQGNGADAPQPLVEAPPEQLLEGLLVGFSDQLAMCSICHTDLREGMAVTVYAYRCADISDWSVARCYCADCGPEGLTSPTLGVTEVIGTATLGMRSFQDKQTHWLCLNDVDIEAISLPTEGTKP